MPDDGKTFYIPVSGNIMLEVHSARIPIHKLDD